MKIQSVEVATKQRNNIAHRLQVGQEALDDADIAGDMAAVQKLQSEVQALQTLLSAAERLVVKSEVGETEAEKEARRRSNAHLLKQIKGSREQVAMHTQALEAAALALCEAAQRITKAGQAGAAAAIELRRQLPEKSRRYWDATIDGLAERDGALAAGIEDLFRREGLFASGALPASRLMWHRHDTFGPVEMTQMRTERLSRQAEKLLNEVQELI